MPSTNYSSASKREALNLIFFMLCSWEQSAILFCIIAVISTVTLPQPPASKMLKLQETQQLQLRTAVSIFTRMQTCLFT